MSTHALALHHVSICGVSPSYSYSSSYAAPLVECRCMHMPHCLIPGPHQKAQHRSQPKVPALRILWEYMAGIYLGWSCRSGWKKGSTLQPAAPTAPAKINPIHVFPGEYVGMVLLPGGAAGIFGVALVWEGQVEWDQHKWEENEFIFHSVTCYTNYIVSRIHVNTPKLRNITCTLVATGVILPSLECMRVWRQLWRARHATWRRACQHSPALPPQPKIGSSSNATSAAKLSPSLLWTSVLPFCCG